MADDKPDPTYEEAYQQSIQLLAECSTKLGFVASSERTKNYYAIWGRDASICATAAFLTQEESLLKTARNTLETLAEHQAPNGQIPSYIELGEDENVTNVVYGGLGEITSIDANLWFIIACQTALDVQGKDNFPFDEYYETYRKVIDFLYCIDANSCGLLEIPVAGDWTDILDRSYHVLYDQTLWYRALKCAASLAEATGHPDDDHRFEESAALVKKRLNEDFWWDSKGTIDRVCEKYKIKNEIDKTKSYPYYQSHLQPFINTWYHRTDAFANVLACQMGIAPRDRAEAIVQSIIDRSLHKPYPLRVLDPPIQEKDDDSHAIRLSEETPWEYHNGGIWPLAGGFWVILLSELDRTDEAHEALRDIAKANRANRDGSSQWGFFEYHHGQDHRPKGTPRLAWNAASYLIAHLGLLENKKACFERGTNF